MTSPQPRADIAALPPYVPGARGGSGVTPVKLSSNENPYGPLPSVVASLESNALLINRYPDMFATELTEALADHLRLAPSEVVLGGGSVAVLAHILQAYCAPGDEVVYAWRSFEAYPILTRLVGAEPVQVPLTADARHDLPAMAAAVTERTKVVMVCSPNNPTGPAVREDEFREFMAAVPERVLVVLDEAYLEFVSDPHAVLGRPLLGMYANLVLLRTFSKAYGLAGLRVGYVAGPEPLVTPVRSCVTPFSVSGPAQAAGLASLAATAELDHRVQVIVAERDRVAAALRMDGWTVPEAQGNFVWLSPGELTVDLATHLGAASTPILVRPFAGNGLRVTIGSPEENDAALAALAAFPARA